MVAAAAASPVLGRERTLVLRSFLAICARDVFVTLVELPSFAVQVLVQPIFLAFILGRILPELGLARADYGDLLLPGVVSLTIVLTALQGTALPLVLELGVTREIEDRLLAPLPVQLVGLEKILVAALRGLVGGLVILPTARAIIGWDKTHLSGSHLALLAAFYLVGALLGSSLGLMLGTLVEPKYISVMFAVVFTPLFYTGATQYPWATLQPVAWFKIVALFNPLTYLSEGLRGSLVPWIEHMRPWIAIAACCGWTLLFATLGIRGLVRRVLD